MFNCLCAMDFLFPQGKIWDIPTVVGLDIMYHPHDPSTLLLLLCFGVGCVILRFLAGDQLPPTIHKFLAAKVLRRPECKTWELSELALKVLGIKKMVGMTEASSFEKHEQIKSAICQSFIVSVIAMRLLRAKKMKSSCSSEKQESFLKNLNSLHVFALGLFKLSKYKKDNAATSQFEDEDTYMFNHTEQNTMSQVNEEEGSIHVLVGEPDDIADEAVLGNPLNTDFNAIIQESDLEDNPIDAEVEKESPANNLFVQKANMTNLGNSLANDKDRDKDFGSINPEKEASGTNKMLIKGILKCPSTSQLNLTSTPTKPGTPSTPNDPTGSKTALKQVNCKGYNVSFQV